MIGPMERTTVMAWVDAYERAWRANDAAAIPALFTEDAHYRRSPYTRPLVGHEALRGFWAEDEGLSFTMRAQPVAVDGRVAVVRVTVNYLAPAPQEYTDLWLLRFTEDDLVEDFEEWAYWPDKPYTADD
jgi:ketosteroid isomerase-like protein